MYSNYNWFTKINQIKVWPKYGYKNFIDDKEFAQLLYYMLQ